MKIEEQTVDSVVVVSLDGRVDGSTAPDLEKHISDVVGRGNTQILLDCSNMDYISSAGLRVVLVGAKKMPTRWRQADALHAPGDL